MFVPKAAQKRKPVSALTDTGIIVSSAKKKPPVLPGEIKSFSKNKTGELKASREYR